MGLPQHPCWCWSFCTSWKLRLVDFGKVIIIARCLWFSSLLHPKFESPWIQTPLCVLNVHICPRVHRNRPPFQMDTGFCAIGVANATGSRYHFMCVEMRYRYAVFFCFWVGGGSCCFVRKYECAVLCSWPKDHTMIWLQKAAVPNIQFRTARYSALIVRMC